MRPITKIIVHGSHTQPHQHFDKSWLEGIHVKQNGWSRIGYHFMIGRGGNVIELTPVEEQGIHTVGHNADSIGIMMLGGMPPKGKDQSKWDFNYTLRQLIELAKLVRKLKSRYPSVKEVSGHRDNDSRRECPGFDVAALLSMI